MIQRRVFGPIAISALIVLSMVRAAGAKPEIFSIDPLIGSAGTHVSIEGKGFEHTNHVLFAVGQTVKPADFKIDSDRKLEVIAPEYYRPGAAATVAVFTREGASIAMPASAQVIREPERGKFSPEPGTSFFHVLENGILQNASSVAVIEAGGVVERGTTPGMQFVKSGGTLLDYRNLNGIVFHEPGAIFGPEIRQSRQPLTFITVPSISVSPGVGPFLYEKPPRPALDDAPPIPPKIRSFSPRGAPEGGILTLRGEGFARTAAVMFVGPSGEWVKTGFRVISDRELRIEVPDEGIRPGQHAPVVLTTEGVTVLVPRNSVVRPGLRQRIPFTGRELIFNRFAPGDVGEIGGSSIAFVENGGLLTESGGGCLFFIQNGGRVGTRVGTSVALFYEPGAVLPASTKAENSAQPVEHIVPSLLPSAVEVLRGPIFRR